jgi:hypothetical protein
MPSSRTGRGRQIRVDVEEARAGNVSLEIELAAAAGFPELPATVDELVAQAYQLPAGEAGSGTDDGWMTYTMPPLADIQASSNCARS